jgi:hypothetical protein
VDADVSAPTPPSTTSSARSPAENSTGLFLYLVLDRNRAISPSLGTHLRAVDEDLEI